MNFYLDGALKMATNNPKTPIRVFFATWPEGNECSPSTERIIDVAAKHLRTFETFRQVVCNVFGVWLDIRLLDYDGRISNRRDDWTDIVADAFADCATWQMGGKT